MKRYKLTSGIYFLMAVMGITVMAALYFCLHPNNSVIPFDRNSFTLESNSFSILTLQKTGEYLEVYHTDDRILVKEVINEIKDTVMTSDPLELIDLAMDRKIVFDDGAFVSFHMVENLYGTEQVYMRLQDKWLYVMSDRLVELIYPLIFGN